MNQIITGAAVFLGEVLIIGAEMWAAKYFDANRPWHVVVPAILVSIFGILFLVYGYTFGYQAFKNIWIVTALSIGGILVVEPIVAWSLFREMPTTGATIALALGVIGIGTSVFVK